MADNERDTMAETPGQRKRETSDEERERIRSSNDRDQALEREGGTSRHNEGYDETAKGQRRDVDPDSAESDIDRDDMLKEP